MKKDIMKKMEILLLAFLMACSICTAAYSSWFSEWAEKTLGDMASHEVELELGVVKDPVLNDWVKDMGTKLSAVSQRKNYTKNFKILDTEEVNALAVPGGHVYVTKGLLRFIDTEDELACVIGHEVGHIAARHSMKSIERQLIFSGLLSLLKDKQFRGFKGVARIYSFFDMLRYSRDNELEADRLGLEGSLDAHYDGSQGLNFFRKLKGETKHRPSTLEIYLSTHPPFEDRIKKLESHPRMDKKDVLNLVKIADSYAQRYLFKEAIGKYQEALKLDPDNLQAHLNLGVAYGIKGMFPESIKEFNRVLELDPENQEAKRNLEIVKKASAHQDIEVSQLVSEEAEKKKEDLNRFREIMEEAKGQLQPELDKINAEVFRLENENKDITALVNMLSYQIADRDFERFRLLSQGELVIGKLYKTIFVLDKIASESQAVWDQMDKVNQQLQDNLTSPSSPSRSLVNSVDYLLLNHKLAIEDLKKAAQWAKEAAREAKGVRQSIGYGAQELNRSLSFPQSMSLLGSINRYFAEAERKVQTTLDKSKKASEALSKAKVREFENQANLISHNASPYQEAIYNRILARYFVVNKEVVEKVRQTGIELGSAALVLAASKSGCKKIEEILNLKKPNDTWVDAAEKLKVDFDALSLLCKPLLRALEQA